MRNKYFLHFLVMSMLFSLHAFSQTIDYTTPPLSEVCNTFNVRSGPVSVSGYEHDPVSAGVGFNHLDSAIALKCQSGNTPATLLGTAYAIKFPIKDGYTYNIQIQAWRPDDPATSAARIDFSLLNALPDPNTSDPVDCGPLDENHWATLASQPVAGTYLDTSKTIRNLGNFTANQAYTYLTVLGWMPPSGTSIATTAFIRKIIITEIAPAYSLSPGNITKACGTALTQTFTITDVHNSGKVTSYTWNLGSANNGWKNNGQAALQTITTTTPSLTLTADDCVTPTNVSATVTRNTGSYTTNTAVVTATDPTPSLSETAQSCGSATFTLSNAGCGALISWSLSPASAGTLSATTGPTTTITTAGGWEQSATLTASVVSSCGNATVSQPVSIPGRPNFQISCAIPCQDGKVVPECDFYATPDDGISTYNWSWRSSAGATGTFTDHSASVSRKFSLGSYTVSAYATNSCGQSNVIPFQFNILACNSVAAEQEKITVSVSPNPASSLVVVTTNTTAPNTIKVQEKQDIREIRIIDKAGQLLRKQLFPAGTTTVTLHVENFKPDIYLLQIGNGKIFQTRKIVITR